MRRFIIGLTVFTVSFVLFGGIGGAAKRKTKRPPPPPPDYKVIHVETGWTHTCALLDTGKVKCWGRNRGGRLGIGSQKPAYIPATVLRLTDIKAISVGGEHTCSLSESGVVQCWGNNAFGQLGDGTKNVHFSPVPVKGIDKKVKAISCGGFHTCAVTEDGGVQCWGRNENGRLGDGTINNRLLPTDVRGLSSGVIAIDAGMDHTCALTDKKKVKCWGSNYTGQIGHEKPIFGSRTTVPEDIEGLDPDIKILTTGWFHTCVLTNSGKVQCWGRNYNGELGTGTNVSSEKPVYAKGLDQDTVSISAFSEHTCAINKKGGVKCWGRNDWGQLGDGTTDNVLQIADVVDLDSGAVQVAPGWRHTCAVMNTGRVKCWGYNKYGMFGNNSRKSSFTPLDSRI